MFHYISEAYSRTDATTIEHELDHLAFCKSKHTEIVRKKKLEYNKLLNKVSEGQDEYEDRVKEVGVEFVYINVDHLTLTELRAHFFNVVPQGERTKADYEVAKEEVFSRFEKGYVKKDLPKRNFFYLINDLNDPELEGMDEATVKCIAKKFYESIHDPDATFYNGFKQEDVNQGVVDYFFDTKLPEFKQGIEAKARLAVDAFAKAFADDPTRFNEADAEAETFDQYVAICNGE